MLLALALSAFAGGYENPPAAIADILDAERPPAVSISPDGASMAMLDRPQLQSIAELADPVVRVGGMQLNPTLRERARSYRYTGLGLKPLGKGEPSPVAIPEGARIAHVSWSPDSAKIAFSLAEDDGLSLYTVDVATGAATRRSEAELNATTGAPCAWLPDSSGLMCKVVPGELGAMPEASKVPTGPRIDENLGRKTPARTYTNLLDSPHDEEVFQWLLTSAVDRISLDGTRDRVAEPALIDELSLSPDGEHLLLATLHGPFSYHVPASRFPLRWELMHLSDKGRELLADLPLADDVPVAFGSVRKGARTYGWRPDQAATLYWVEALDGGDAGAEAEWRDAVYQQPVGGDSSLVWKTNLRFGGITWGDADTAMASEWWWSTRTEKSWRLDPSVEGGAPKLLWERDYQDAYLDPGSPVTEPGPYGRGVLRFAQGDQIYLTGDGASPEGVYPFLDRLDLATGKSTRLWRSSGETYESVVEVLDDAAKQIVTRRQSPSEPPNYLLKKNRRRDTALTSFEDWAPAFADVKKEVVSYTRTDGLELSGTLYLPPGYDPADGPLPTVLWAYPREFKDKKAASRITESPYTFSRPGGSSVLLLLLEGYAVLDGPKIPIIGEGDAEPNDSYVEQLVGGAKAAVDYLVERGVTDPDKVAIGGHSYGAFTTANLLAHSDLFRAGIARSGAYNRSLTPFGFQAEQRTYWEATDTYIEMSPFTHVAKIDEPILLIHGAEDSNSGTYPVQSERMFEALKGHGATARWVELPLEDHGYRARESVGHTLWEMLTWLDTYVKNAPPRSSGEEPAEPETADE
ncbi:MAG: S9 family peptidase [Deltaproteobacteria bacterium]|nr:MAG: S9 family peptidase [Deltaproteobacteria bacterium]